MTKFMLMAMPLAGHVAPVLAVAAELVGRGHDVRVYTGRAYRERVEATGASWLGWQRAPDFDEHDLETTFPRLRGRPGIGQVITNLADLFIGTAPGQVADLRDEWQREPWDILVAEESTVAPRLCAESLGCHWVTLAVLPLGLPSREGPPNGLGLLPGHGPVGKARDALLRSLTPALGSALGPALSRARRAAGLSPSRLPFDRAVFSSELILASGVPALDHHRTDRPKHLRWVGNLTAMGVTPRTSSGLLPDWWSDLDGKVVVHVTQGTFNIDPTDLIRPTLEALADLDLIVVVTTGRRGHDRLPFSVPCNARVAGFIPYDLLLPRVDAMVTNGGWGGTLGALAHGIPLVIAGGDLDKPEIAARVEASGAAVNLRNGRPSPRQVGAAVGKVLNEGTYRDAARNVATELDKAGGASKAADLLDEFASRV
ncbi:glycosyltransferase [Gulosibacter molinativorax]|uniref:Glycosyl transferase n=1 Tax=Gulosibacter molinativorax TaxID=256821 RepID=A0ABT7C7K8_9MICO|nr:nucleotide disphospho-sugar-binding domain-containing protein [Gulosibacter molinativorax]MDJ1371180.1 glycosyl transferase [Gulosibacter molinativorax]QUY62995.1 Staurosporine biosynthesis N-glycosyltransferase StaG [Gulosibacter molinativorax]